jgi:CubicO group peptidase (beta-lactamase class C family)
MLADRGMLDVDAPVAQYWPEFAAGGKQDVRVSWVLAHQAGLPGLRDELPVDAHVDWQVMTDALAGERPWWTPGTALGYHAMTWGWLAGEILRRIDGRSVGAFVRDEVVTPLGIDFHIGAPPELDARTATIATGPARLALPVLLYWLRTPRRMSMRMRSLSNPRQRDATVDTRAWRAAEIPAANGISNARALARLYGVLARGGEGDGAHLLRPAALDRAIRTHSEGRDLMFGFRSHFGLGFMLDSVHLGIAPGSRSFGHTGAGGGFAFADPERRLGFAYTPNRPHLQSRLLVAPARALVRAIYASL